MCIRDSLRAEHRVPKLDGLPGFAGGLVGWFGFECIEYIEPCLRTNAKPDELGTPDILLMLSDELAVFDNLKGRLYLIVHADPRQPQAWARANRRLDSLSHRLRHGGAPYPETLVPAAIDESDFRSSFSREQYHEVVRKAQEYIRAGDIFQVVLSQRIEITTGVHPFQIYRALRIVNPSPYMFYLKLGDTTLLGASPEMLVRCTGRRVDYRPIAGTRPRGATDVEDMLLGEELRTDEKETAEHVMLVDLGRNDLSGDRVRCLVAQDRRLGDRGSLAYRADARCPEHGAGSEATEERHSPF